MPHNNSAAKRLRKNETRRVANKARLTELKSLRKRLERHLHDGEVEQAKKLFVQFTKRLDQASSVNTVHKNTASRLKSRVALAIAKPPKAAAPAAK
ncbi:MAG: 30S ribosomal protein S20 [Planctomycetes bacterium]|nr:30S ribosomal protein S20 [Planctomycetota bacterium]